MTMIWKVLYIYIVNLLSILAYWMCLCVFVEDGVVLLFVCLGRGGMGWDGVEFCVVLCCGGARVVAAVKCLDHA